MRASLAWCSADLAYLPDGDRIYEIVDGELLVTRAPHWQHQNVCGNLYAQLQAWWRTTRLGRVGIGIGVIFDDYNDVIPDVVWVSTEKYERFLDAAGHLRGAPDLVVEVLSPGPDNERRDRQVKLKLYSSHGVLEYWIVDWLNRQVSVYRRTEGALQLAMTLYPQDTLTSPLLPGFACPVAELFA